MDRCYGRRAEPNLDAELTLAGTHPETPSLPLNERMVGRRDRGDRSLYVYLPIRAAQLGVQIGSGQ